MLGKVVSLIDEEWFARLALAVIFLPRLEIISHHHHRVLLQSLNGGLVNVEHVFVLQHCLISYQVQIRNKVLKLTKSGGDDTYHSLMLACHHDHVSYLL